MSHYTLQVIKISLSWRGRARPRQLWAENFATYPQALVRAQQLEDEGHTWVLHDWGTDPGPSPEPLSPGVDNENEDSWDYTRHQRRIDKINASYGDVPF